MLQMIRVLKRLCRVWWTESDRRIQEHQKISISNDADLEIISSLPNSLSLSLSFSLSLFRFSLAHYRLIDQNEEAITFVINCRSLPSINRPSNFGQILLYLILFILILHFYQILSGDP